MLSLHAGYVTACSEAGGQAPGPRTMRGNRWALVAAGMLMFGGVGAQCCDHTLSMQDSYGDGWNGGTLQVRVNGELIGTFAAAGSASQAVFEACTGDALELIYASGDWEEENTYQVYGPAGNVLFADGPTPAVGVAWTGSTDCAATVDPATVPCAALPIDTTNCVLVDNTGVLGSGISGGCANYNGGDLWYGMVVPPSGNIVITTQSTGGLDDTGVALWTGPDCFNLTRRACDDDSGEGFFSRIVAQELPVGDLLLIQVYGYGGGTGAFELCVEDPGTVQLESSELPIVLIHTNGQDIPFDGRITARMEMKYAGSGSLTFLNGPSNEYDGAVGIGIRGATSAGYPQRPFNVETRTALGENNNVPLLGMPEENDWVLLSNFNDRSLVRNSLAIYTFSESIKRDNGRVDIARLDPDELTGEPLSGGYILEQNLRGPDNSFQSNFSPIDHPGLDVHFLYKYPEADIIAPEQRAYIASFVDSLETALYSPTFTDPVAGYRRYLDVPSFITYFLVNEVARNNDGFKKSVYFHKDRNSNGGKLKAGPVWDFDWAWKEIQECDIVHGPNGSGWAHRINDCPTDNNSTGWYIRLFQDSTFTSELRCTYELHRQGALSELSINAYIDSVAALVQNAQARHFQKWPILGVSGPAPEAGPFGATYVEDLEILKQWIAVRLAWLDDNIPGVCNGVSVGEATRELPRVFMPFGSDQLRFSGTWSNGPHELVLLDMAGRMVNSIPVQPGRGEVSIGPLASGTYLYTVLEGGAAVAHGKLVVAW